MEAWKAVNITNYPMQATPLYSSEHGIRTRGGANNKVKVNNTPNTCNGDSFRLWNLVPDTIRNTKSLIIAKMESKKYCKTLPI